MEKKCYGLAEISREYRHCLGCGGQILFWHDAWYIDEALSSMFPEVYNIAKNKNALVGVEWKEEANTNSWVIHFNR